MNNIAKLRKTKGITLRALSEKVPSVGKSAIGNYEAGTRSISVSTAWEIVNALKSLGVHCYFQDVFPNPKEINEDARQSDKRKFAS